MNTNVPLVAAVELGGTSVIVCFASLNDPTTILHKYSIPTTLPQPTLSSIRSTLLLHPYQTLGIATFGPVDLNPSSPTYGYITQTPKANWSNTDILTPLISVNPSATYKLDTDVNAPALAEYTFGSMPSKSVAYVTVGTGVGVGIVVNGSPVHGLMHPEAGHVPIVPLEGDEFR
eukprot:CAMPEP_0118650328 /NCGR_PEP_ID=MMETSP0785-20121206/10190_1 /TAXON_ID=91992 /ORGANISM="Bolidomonas pacifica, Strain CCMP 1866" /LENGTH=173 /DNA_ID=CAMNT_0006542699 /DNA_START=118 /DNA_END=636 /DNA_ORIENTATION=+